MKTMILGKNLVASLVLAACGSVCAAGALAATVDQSVAAAVAAGGKARVIVNLTQPGAFGGDWSTARAAGGEGELGASIAETQAGVLASVGGELDLFYRYETVAGLAGEVSARGLEILLSHPAVESIQEDIFVELAHNESRPLIGANLAHAAGYTGQGVEVAVIDTGIDTDHQDLADDLIARRCYVSHGAGCVNISDAEDRNGHGTHVSGTITGKGTKAPKGIAPNAWVTSIRVFNATGGVSSADLNAALDYVNRYRPFAAAVNMSLGGGKYSGSCNTVNTTTTNLINALRSRGTLVFVASHNQGWPQHMAWPACITNAVAVGATYDTGGSVNKVTTYSNSSVMLDLLAPGSWITSTYLNNGVGNNWNGTSMATPHAAAVAALVRSKNGTLSAVSLETTLKNTGLWVKDLRQNRWTKRVTANTAVNSVATGLKPGWQWVQCRYFNRSENAGYSWCYADGIGWVYDYDNLIESAFSNATAGKKWIALYVNNLSGNIQAVQLQY